MADPRLARGDPRLRTSQTSTPIQAAPASAPPNPPPPPSSSPPEESIGAPVPANSRVPDEGAHPKDFKLRFCTVCASNNNRSMEAHLRLATANYPVISFGTGSFVRLPGPSMTEPYIYNFNVTSYQHMHDELSNKNAKLNRANGVLNMLERNRKVKFGPERWQDWSVGKPRLDNLRNDQGAAGTEGGVVDVVITCEDRCWDAVVDNLLERGSPMNRPVHVINVDIKDSHEEALVGGKAILDLADSLNATAIEERNKAGSVGWEGGGASRSGFDERVPDVLASWQERWPNLPALWTLSWF